MYIIYHHHAEMALASRISMGALAIHDDKGHNALTHYAALKGLKYVCFSFLYICRHYERYVDV